MSINNIKNIYNINQITSGNSSPVSASMIIAFFFIIFLYLIRQIILKDISYDWENKRCTPKYIFYSGFLKSNSGDPIKDTYDNFVECTDPTRIPKDGESKFKIVFDTKNTIINTANSVMDYSNDIMNEAERIKNEGTNRLSSSKEKTNVVTSSMNQLYNYQLKLYTILKIYFERIFLILDTLTSYVTDITLYSLAVLKSQLYYKGKQLTIFINSNLTEYENIYKNDITDALKSLEKISNKPSSTNRTDIDYINFVNKINSATNRYSKLSEELLEFDRLNRSKLDSIDKQCQELQSKNIKYKSIFPYLEEKILKPELFNSVDIKYNET